MSSTMFDLRQLRYFVAVAEELGFARAAVRLGISQPPLSQQIQAMEAALGMRLFDRSTRVVSLTRSGAAFLVEARKVLEQASRSADLMDRVRRGELGRLFIGTITSACHDILPQFLARLSIERPDINIALRERDTARSLLDLKERRLDIAFARLDSVAEPLNLLPVRKDSFELAIPDHHPLAGSPQIPLKALQGVPLAMVSREISPRFYDTIIAAFVAERVEPALIHECGSIQSQVSFVSSGICCALVPNSNQQLRIPGVVYRPLAQPIALTGIAMVWREPVEESIVAVAVDVAKQIFQAPKKDRLILNTT